MRCWSEAWRDSHENLRDSVVEAIKVASFDGSHPLIFPVCRIPLFLGSGFRVAGELLCHRDLPRRLH